MNESKLLQVVKGFEDLIILECSVRLTYQQAKTMNGIIMVDGNYVDYADEQEKSTGEIKVSCYVPRVATTFLDAFSSFGRLPDELVLTREQQIAFIELHHFDIIQDFNKNNLLSPMLVFLSKTTKKIRGVRDDGLFVTLVYASSDDRYSVSALSLHCISKWEGRLSRDRAGELNDGVCFIIPH